jgi:RNA polymerase sigma factor (sigma-70 family)
VTLPHALLERFQAGDASAFAEVVRAHSGLVRRIVAGYWSSLFEQEEAMQEVWAHLFRQRETLDLSRADEFAGWVATLARRRALDLSRRPRDPGAAGRDEDALEGLEEPSPARVDPAELSELSAAVEDFQSKLKPAWRQFFVLYFVQELDYAEVATALKISRLRCKYMKKVLLRRARKNVALGAALGRADAGGGRGSP